MNVPRANSPLELIELRFERGAQISVERRIDRWSALILPLESTVVELAIGDAPSERLDRASLALVPASAPYLVTAHSPVGQLLTLLITPRARELACREYDGHIDDATFVNLIATPRVLPRTRWVDELVHRYLFERDVCKKDGSNACRFLETELTKELYFSCKERDEDKTRRSVVHEEKDLVRRARAFIERDLAAPLVVSELARHCATSESTLLRAFQRELGTTPAAFARDGKLNAALLLLQSKRYSVGEVATRVGYGNLSSFTTAFRRRFGSPPSLLLQADASLEILPPQGKPPRRKRRKI